MPTPRRQRVGTRLANVPDADTHRISVAYAPDVAAAVLAVLRAGSAIHGAQARGGWGVAREMAQQN